MQKYFKELPRALRQCRRKLRLYLDCSLEKAAAKLLEPLCKVLGEVQKKFDKLRRSFSKAVLAPSQTVLLKGSMTTLLKLLSKKGPVLTLPWRLVRDAATSLNNKFVSSPKAAIAIINGLVSHFAVHRPSERGCGPQERPTNSKATLSNETWKPV